MSEANQEATTDGTISVEVGLKRIGAKLPGALKFRLQNTFDHFDRASQLFDTDREMASFRAITGEEEAATALMRAVQLRRYSGSNKLIAHRHQHKAAVIACMMAIGSRLAPILAEFQLIFHFEKLRIDIKVPLSAFGVEGGGAYAIQPVEPLDMLHTKPGVPEEAALNGALDALAEDAGFASVKKMIDIQANARNHLLYASDSALPRSKATLESLSHRKRRALAMLVLTVMVYQSRKHLAMVTQAIPAILTVISRIPKEPSSGAE